MALEKLVGIGLLNLTELPGIPVLLTSVKSLNFLHTKALLLSHTSV